MSAASLQILQDDTCWRLPQGLRQIYVAIMQALIRVVDQRSDPVRRNDNCWTMSVLAVPARGATDGR
jgi:hypothetical protein